MEIKKATIIILTYHVENLILCIPQLKFLNFDFNLLVHNDNPKYEISPMAVKQYGYDGVIHVINETENQGMLKSRMKCLDYIIDNPELESEYVIFSDDDDLLFNVQIPSGYRKIIYKVMPIVKVADWVKFYNNGFPNFPLCSTYSKIKENYGVSGNAYNFKMLLDYYLYLKDFMPMLKATMGTDIINAGEDDIFDGLYYLFAKHHYPDEKFALKRGEVLTGWNLIESPTNRYGIGDSRYSDEESSKEKEKDFLIRYEILKNIFISTFKG